MRSTTRHAPHGMVASVDHLASAAGLAMLRAGGSAADAAIAASGVLAVTAPHLCGMGGDLFALVHDPQADRGAPPAALNASGRAGSGADAVQLRVEGHTTMPFRLDIRSAPVPGCVDGWLALHERFGRLPLADVLEPAVLYAASGFPASPLLAGAVGLLGDAQGADDLLEHHPLHHGDLVRRPGVAMALEAVIRHGRAGFYQGPFGEGLLALGDGEYTPADLERPLFDWVEPLCARAWGHDVWTIPPNSQGYLTLLAAAIAEGLALPASPDDPLWAHLLVEASRAAAYDRVEVLHEGARARVEALLDEAEVARRRALIDPERRSRLTSAAAPGGTMYLCAVDSDRMGVSLIQSNASNFGTYLFEPTTGIGLHNRGLGFSLEPGHPAEYGPGRRPPHTLSPALVTHPNGNLRAVIGTMGGDSQPQILVQLLARMLRDDASPAAAVSAPRWVLANPVANGFDCWTAPDDVIVLVEDEGEAAWAEGLRSRGHEVITMPGVTGTFGHAQVIEVGPDGLAGAADPRAMISEAAGY
jgi:gamma-glutamyltranspeptidase/glutathione hydrolase